MLPAAELASLRDEAERALASTCNLITVERTRDARGNVVEVTVTGPDFACAVDPVDIATEVETIAQVNVTQAYRVSMPLSIVVAESDRIGADVEGEVRILTVIGPGGMETDAALRDVIAVESD